jgi:hypothetical protein
MLLSQPLETYTEESTLSLTAAAITKIKQALQCESLILLKCVLK